MIFSSASFIAFFLVVLGCYRLAPSYAWRAGVIFVSSIVFYASWKPAYLILLSASLSINYWFYFNLTKRRSLALLSVGVGLNVLTLFIIKYLALFLETALALAPWFGMETGIEKRPDWLNWALPLGISFYTFHMLSVMIDVYRGEWTKPISFFSWAMYVTFFPHMIAGPILRASELVEQLERLGPLTLANLRYGCLIFLGGFLKKILLADNLAPLVDQLYPHPEHMNMAMSWVATVAFALQIYFDFSGYSEMAIGLARIFGVTLPRNFKYPYISRNVREFWQRWHITLSRWLRDYLYISLGGSRRGTARNMINLMTTMLLGGLWHGAGWTFVFWGLLHGLYLVGHRFILFALERFSLGSQPVANRIVDILAWPFTMALVCFTWVFFRANDFKSAWTVSALMLGVNQGMANDIHYLRIYEYAFIAMAAAIAGLEPLIVDWFAKRRLSDWWRLPFPLRGLAYAILILTAIVFGGGTQKFIYFDF
jgi:D-alanyl-lipoteichoic acid acyltransferase DltB (MBOAT superfamily)